MTTNWDEIFRRFPAGLTILGNVVSICTRSFTRADQLQRVQEFFEKQSTKGFDQALAQSSDSVKAKNAWLDRDLSDVEAWVKAYKTKQVKSEL